MSAPAAHSLGELIAPPPVTQAPAISLSLPRQIAVVPGGLLLQLRPCEAVTDAMTSPLTVSGAAPLPLPIRIVVPPTLPGHPADPGQDGGETDAALILTRFFSVTSLELRAAKPADVPWAADQDERPQVIRPAQSKSAVIPFHRLVPCK